MSRVVAGWALVFLALAVACGGDRQPTAPLAQPTPALQPSATASPTPQPLPVAASATPSPFAVPAPPPPPLTAGQRSLFVINADGTGLRQLLADTDGWGFQWSPDGRHLAFSARLGPPSQRYAVYLLEVATGSSRAIVETEERASFGAPAWSPRGDWLAVAMYAGRGEEKVLLVRPDGSQRHEIEGRLEAWSPDGSSLLVVRGEELGLVDGATLEFRPLVSSFAKHWRRSASWSPDGRWIAYLAPAEARCGPFSQAIALWVVKADGSEGRQVAEPTCGGTATPAWSPDGRSIAYVSTGSQDPEAIARWGVSAVDLETGTVRPLTRPQRDFDIEVHWLAGGRYLAVERVNCISCEPSYWSMALVDAQGQQQAEWEVAGPTGYALSRDGQRLALGTAEGRLLVGVPSGGEPAHLAQEPPFQFFSLAWSPDGRRLAFVRGPLWGNIAYVAGADGRSLEALPLHPKAYSIALSPDWSHVAYSLRGKLYVARRDGSGARPVAEAPAGSPRWSPDGRRLAFLLRREGELRVAVANADGTGLRTHKGPQRTGAQVQLGWSPDGRRLAWAEWGALGVIDVESGEETTLARDIDRQPSTVAWSPEGTRIAYMSREGLSVINADGSGSQVLSPRKPAVIAWSPDGRRIAFADPVFGRRLGEENGLYVVGADGNGESALFTAEVRLREQLRITDLLWSPDSRRIAFSAARGGIGAQPEIFLVDAKGGGLARLTGPLGFGHFLLGWSADGRYIAFVVSFSSL